MRATTRLPAGTNPMEIRAWAGCSARRIPFPSRPDGGSSTPGSTATTILTRSCRPPLPETADLTSTMGTTAITTGATAIATDADAQVVLAGHKDEVKSISDPLVGGSAQ